MYKIYNQSDLELSLPTVATCSKCINPYEPRHEKTCLRGFRLGKTQTGLLSSRNKLESAIASRDIILSRQRTTKALIRLRGCAGWSAPLLFAYGIKRFSHDVAHIWLIDFSIPINWMSPFPNLGVSGAFFYFYFIFGRIFCKQTVQTLIRRRVLRRLIWVWLGPKKGR